MAGAGQNPYSGRWVARLGGRIVAQGGTPEQARLAALSRFKEKPEIVFMSLSDPFIYPPLLAKVIQACPADQDLYLVGGAVRDMLLGRALHDFDFTLAHSGIKIARKVADALGADFYPLDPERDTGRVLVPSLDAIPIVLDFTSFRGPDLDADLAGRDFTLNAIALELRKGQIFDPLGGAQDLKDKRLRACSALAFIDDPVRILRAVRLAADYDLHILPETRLAMKDAAPRLVEASAERIRDELFRALEGSKPSACIRALDMLGALGVILPETTEMKGVNQPLPHQHDVWEHTVTLLRVLEEILAALAPAAEPETADDLLLGSLVLRIGRYRQEFTAHNHKILAGRRTMRGLLFLAALFHDVAKPNARQVDEDGECHFWDHDQFGAEMAGQRGRLLALSNEEISHLQTIIRNHMRVHFHTRRLLEDGKPPTRRAIYRFFRDSGEAGVDLCLLALADLRATYGHTLPQETWAAALDVVRSFLENWYEKPTESINPVPLVNGDELMETFMLKPGPRIGELLLAIREAQATGKVQTHEQALSLAGGMLADDRNK